MSDVHEFPKQEAATQPEHESTAKPPKMTLQHPMMTSELAKQIIGDRKIEFTFDEVMAIGVVANPSALMNLPLSQSIRLGDIVNGALERALAKAQE